jgi:dihydrolipoamide dehydrogenase
MENKKFDIGIIGAGPAGYNAAIRACQLGKTVVLFEKEHLGGTCLNKGCIPTKTFLHAADVYNSIKKAAALGIEVENYSVNFEKVAERKEKTVQKIRKSLEMLLKSYGIEIVQAEAKIIEKGLIESNGEQYECENILVATGSSPKCVGGFEFDHEFILSSDDVLELKTLPKKLLIVGSGAIGIEWARIFSSFGSEVTVVEIADRLLPLADFEVSVRLERTFKMAKIKMYLATSVKKIEDKKVELSNGEVLEPDFVLFATGRGINVQENSAEAHLVGDVYGEVQLAHFASHQAVSVIENIVSGKPRKDFIVPSVVYGEPEIAWVGESEQELIRKNVEYKKVTFPISALGKAYCDNNLEGFIKVLTAQDKILGAHIISKEASALIHQFLIAMQNGLGVEDLKNCCFAHPTYSEGVYESLLALDGISLSLPKEK